MESYRKRLIRSSMDNGRIHDWIEVNTSRLLYLGTRDAIDFYSSKKVTDLKIRVEEKV